MECRGHSRAATQPAPQGRSNPSFCANNNSPPTGGLLLFCDDGSVSHATAHDFSEVPHLRRRTGSGRPVFRFFVLKTCRLGTAVQTHGIPAPAVLLFQQARATALRAVLQRKLLVNVFHICLL